MSSAVGKVHVWELDESYKVHQSVTHKVGMLPIMYLHDFQITKNWWVDLNGVLTKSIDPGSIMHKVFKQAVWDQNRNIYYQKQQEPIVLSIVDVICALDQ